VTAAGPADGGTTGGHPGESSREAVDFQEAIGENGVDKRGGRERGILRMWTTGRLVPV